MFATRVLALASLLLAACSSQSADDSGSQGGSEESAGEAGASAAGEQGGAASASGGASNRSGASNAAGEAAGEASAGAATADGCSGDAEGRARCNSAGDLETCRQGRYVVDESCGSLERCNASRRACLECAPGEFRCSEERLEQCNLEGSAYEVLRSCASADACVALGATGFCRVCEPGALFCESGLREFDSTVERVTNRTLSSSSLRECNLDGSGTLERDHCGPEAPVCDRVAGRCLLCEPGTTACAGSRLVTCDAEGLAFENETECGHPALCDAAGARCLPSACQGSDAESMDPGEVECRGADQSELQVCGPSGQWEELANCASQATCDAVARRCHDDDECLPGSTRCEGNVLELCAEASIADGWHPRAGSAYYPYQLCTGACVESTAGAACDQVERTLCGPGETREACDADLVCDGTLAETCAVCVPGSYRCADGVLSLCENSAEGGYAIVGVETCASGVCDAERGACLLARPGEYACVAGSYVRILSNGEAAESANCGSQELCDPSAGCRAPACVVGSRLCGGDDGNEELTCADGLAPSLPVEDLCPSAERCEQGLGCARAARVTAGDSHSCALFVPEGSGDEATGYLKCWGGNDSGQLGNGAVLSGDEPEARPVLLAEDGGPPTASPHFRTSGLCAGRSFTCADFGAPGQLPTVTCWGANVKGQLGNGMLVGNTGSTPSAGFASLLVTDGMDVAPTDGMGDPLKDLSQVTCGADFACALDATGVVWCWGANDAGQLGRGEVSDLASPLARPLAGEHEFTRVVAGARHACALERDAGIYCWGEGTKGQLGMDPPATSAAPVRVGTLEGIAIGAGRDFTLATASDQPALLGWGQNLFGQLALGTGAASNTPAVATALPAVSVLFSGPSAAHACALRSGTLVCWGANALGQLGDGTTLDRSTPVDVIEPASAEIEGLPGSVALGKAHSCAIDVTGSLWCWGNNRRFQLGSAADRPSTLTPFRVY